MTLQDILASGLHKEWKDDIVRLVVPASVLARKETAVILDRLRKESGARSVQAVPRRDAPSTPAAPALHAGMTAAEMVDGYLESHPLEGVEPGVVRRAMLELLREPGDA